MNISHMYNLIVWNSSRGVCTNKNRRQIHVCTITEALKVHTKKYYLVQRNICCPLGTFIPSLDSCSYSFHLNVPSESLKLTSSNVRRCVHTLLLLCIFYSPSMLSAAGGICPSFLHEVLAHVFSQWDGYAKFCFSSMLRHTLPSLINDWFICV